MRGTLIVMTLLVTADLSAQERPADRDPVALLSGVPCAARALGSLGSWSADLEHGLAETPGPTGVRAIRLPTPRIGTWVRIAVEPDGGIRLERISAEGVVARTFDTSCAFEETTARPTGAPDADAFSDRVLAERLAVGDVGVILLWSPHMPLSVDEFAELQAVATALQLSPVAVLDPNADLAYAREVAAERDLPDGAVRRLASIELAFRGMTTHAPSLQVFAGGRLVGPVLYGYRDRETARLAIAAVLAGR